MNLLSYEKLHHLHDQKLLLAFSGGADSTALFFTLLEHKIPFDIAIVNYALRSQANEEVLYAQELSEKHSLTCHLFKAPKVEKNFEYEARHIRYAFFEELIHKHKYTHLLTAHHLQDRLEWMLMQLCKGAGSAELLGMQENESRAGYTVSRPLLELNKEEIIAFLESQKIKYFHDETNDDLSYKRNYFRHEIATKLLHEYSAGIKQSFRYLEEDVKELIKEVQVHDAQELSLFISTGNKRSDIFHIDKILKAKGYILSAQQREELTVHNEIIAGRKFLIVVQKGIYYIAPYITTVMDKEFKEECRVLGVPVKLRPYLFKNPIAFILFTRFLPCSI